MIETLDETNPQRDQQKQGPQEELDVEIVYNLDTSSEQEQNSSLKEQKQERNEQQTQQKQLGQFNIRIAEIQSIKQPFNPIPQKISDFKPIVFPPPPPFAQAPPTFPNYIPQHQYPPIQQQYRPNYSQFPPMFGAPQQQTSDYQKIHQVSQFDDDEPIQPKILEEGKQKAHYDLEKNLSLQILTQYQKGKLLKIHQYLPGVVTIKTNDVLPESQDKESDEQTRVGVDLICLIDKSGSMEGDKIQMVKSALNLLLDFLTPNDRLQLISFDSYAQRLTPLKKVTDDNKQYFKAIIAQLYSGGCTSISDATRLAIQQLEQRKYRNNVTSIFLLSDGQDDGAENKFQQQLEKVDEVFTLHSFGFGKDHDAKLMTKMCGLKNGSFYFVSDITLLDEFFADALGGLISVVGKELEIKIKCQPKSPFQKIQIHKTYGKMWIKNGQEYIIKLPQIASGSRKDFVFELQLPEFDQVIGDEQRQSQVMEVQLKITDALTGQVLEKNAQLQLTFYNENEIINENEENIEVAVQYYRVKGTEVIDDARRACDRGNHEEGSQKIDSMINIIQRNKVVSIKATDILEDLKQAKQASLRSNYSNYGQQQMVQIAHNSCIQQGVNSQFTPLGYQIQQKIQSPYQNVPQFKMMSYAQAQKPTSYIYQQPPQ